MHESSSACHPCFFPHTPRHITRTMGSFFSPTTNLLLKVFLLFWIGGRTWNSEVLLIWQPSSTFWVSIFSAGDQQPKKVSSSSEVKKARNLQAISLPAKNLGIPKASLKKHRWRKTENQKLFKKKSLMTSKESSHSAQTYKNQDLSALLLIGPRSTAISPPVIWGIETAYTNSNKFWSKFIGFYIIGYSLHSYVYWGEGGWRLTEYRSFLSLSHFLNLLMFLLIDMLTISSRNNKEHHT